jgi:hypothetical protein
MLFTPKSDSRNSLDGVYEMQGRNDVCFSGLVRMARLRNTVASVYRKDEIES